LVAMALCPGDTTEWDDIQRRFGNFAPRPKEVPQREVDKALQEAAEQIDVLDRCNLGELDQLEDKVEEDTLASYRKKRIAELKAAQRSARFGEVLHLTRTTFVAQVTEASANGQWVLVLLYVDASFDCHYIVRPWAEAAKRFPAVKFMRGVASEVVPDFPDSSTPMVFLYRNGECQKQIAGIEEWGGSRCSTDCIEWVLSKEKIVETELDEDPRLRRPEDRDGAAGAGAWKREERRRGESSGEDEEDSDAERGDDRCYSSNRLGNLMR